MRSNASVDFVRLFEVDGSGGLSVEQSTAVAEPARDVSAAECGAGGEVLSIEELARRFNVSTKTISRWREHGLVAQRYSVGGRRRVGFLADAVERFIARQPTAHRTGRPVQPALRTRSTRGSSPGPGGWPWPEPAPPTSTDGSPSGWPQRGDDPLHDQAARPGASRVGRVPGGRRPAAAREPRADLPALSARARRSSRSPAAITGRRRASTA